jgi:hypothetical protein
LLTEGIKANLGTVPCGLVSFSELIEMYCKNLCVCVCVYLCGKQRVSKVNIPYERTTKKSRETDSDARKDKSVKKISSL